MTAGGIRKRCRCRDASGKDLGTSCPKLKGRKHGTWQVRHELPAAASGHRRTFRRDGYEIKDDAQAVLDRVREILNLAEDDEDREYVAVLLDGLTSKEPLPETEVVRKKLRAGQPLNSKETIGEGLDKWLPNQKKRLRRSTYELYESHVRLYLKPKVGDVRKDRLRISHLSEMFASIEDDNDTIGANNDDRRALLEQVAATSKRAEKRSLRAQLADMPPFKRPVGAASRQRILATLRKYLNDEIVEQELTFNPAAHFKIHAKRARPIIWTTERVEQWRETGLRPGPVMVWTPPQAGIFLDFVADEDPEFESLWHLAIHRGPRRGELAGLSWPEVHEDQATIEIRAQLTEVGYVVEEEDTKTEAGSRTIPVDAEGMRLLKAHRRWQRQEKLRLGEAWQESGRVWTKPDGDQLRPSSIGDRFERLRTAAGLPPVRLHDLRHIAATLMFAAKIDPKIVQETLGHSALAVTMDTYTSVLPELAAEAAEATASIVPRRRTAGHPSGTRNGLSSSTDYDSAVRRIGNHQVEGDLSVV